MESFVPGQGPLANRESRRAFALMTALRATEITLGEFTDLVSGLSSETLLVTASALTADAQESDTPARRICITLALSKYSLS